MLATHSVNETSYQQCADCNGKRNGKSRGKSNEVPVQTTVPLRLLHSGIASEIAQNQREIAEFSDYLKLIGRGKKAGKTLTQEQAYRAMSLLLQQQVTAEQRGAFLMLLRVREETETELAGFLQACREVSQWHTFSGKHNDTLQPDLDLGCYAGKRRHLPWLVLAVMALAQQGYRIFLHGSPEPTGLQTPIERLYLSEVWQAFGWRVVRTPEQAALQLQQQGFCYAPLSAVNPALYELIQLRATLGLRSCANTLARMLNPSQAKHSVHGVFHRHFDERHVQVAKLLGDDSVACFRGDAGEIEVNPERDCVLWRCRQGNISHHSMPALLQSTQVKPRTLAPEQIRDVWQGQANLYGVSAVVGTIAVLLAVLEQGIPANMLPLAQNIWLNRDRTWPN